MQLIWEDGPLNSDQLHFRKGHTHLVAFLVGKRFWLHGMLHVPRNRFGPFPQCDEKGTFLQLILAWCKRYVIHRELTTTVSVR